MLIPSHDKLFPVLLNQIVQRTQLLAAETARRREFDWFEPENFWHAGTLWSCANARKSSYERMVQPSGQRLIDLGGTAATRKLADVKPLETSLPFEPAAMSTCGFMDRGSGSKSRT
jgi:hypothetical protein